MVKMMSKIDEKELNKLKKDIYRLKKHNREYSLIARRLKDIKSKYEKIKDIVENRYDYEDFVANILEVIN